MKGVVNSSSGLWFVIKGTVFSGHPTRTTLFNTMRSILYNKYMLSKINVSGMVLASGDDILCFTDKPVHKWDLSFIGKAGGGLGLG